MPLVAPLCAVLFAKINLLYYKAILVYDVSSRKSFANLDRWLEELRDYTNGEDKQYHIDVVLVANKVRSKLVRLGHDGGEILNGPPKIVR
jgi:hypothetical protein